MIYVDDKGLPTDKTGDCGDSAHFCGALASIFPQKGFGDLLHNYLTPWGWLMRHPKRPPDNNILNCTRDQWTAWAAGCYHAKKAWPVILTLAWLILRLDLFQNIQRDYKGSWKYPWPHSFVNDKGLREKRAFDFADFLTPGGWCFGLKAGRIPLYVILLPFFYLELVLFCVFDKGDDETNMILQCSVVGLGSLRVYKRLRKNWEKKLWRRWVASRDMIEIYEGLRGIVHGRTTNRAATAE